MAGKQPATSSISVTDAQDYRKPVGSHTTNATLSAAQTLTRPAGAAAIRLQAFTQNVRYTLDGTTPTAATGFQLASGNVIDILFTGTAIKVIEETASASIQYQWMA